MEMFPGKSYATSFNFLGCDSGRNFETVKNIQSEIPY